MITFRCPKCNREARAADEHAGKKAKCPGCGNIFQIPTASESAPPPAAKPPAKPSAKPAASSPAAPPKAERPARPAPPPPAPKGRPPKDVDEDEDVVDAPEPEDEEEPEEEEEDRPRRRKGKGKKKSGPKGRPGTWAPCPKCGSTDAKQQHFTWWGGFIGPMMINSVRCQECGTGYNGIHGDLNTNRILIYCLAPLGVVIVLCGGCGFLALLGGLMGNNP